MKHSEIYFDKKGIKYSEQPESFFSDVQIFAKIFYKPALLNFELIKIAKESEVVFYITVATIYYALRRLNENDLEDKIKDNIKGIIEGKLKEWDINGYLAFQECKTVIDEEYNRLVKLHLTETDKSIPISHAIGNWILLNILKHKPQTEEENETAIRIGKIITFSFYDCWT